MNENTPDVAMAVCKAPRKIYQSPLLIEYGAIHLVTQGSGNSAKPDATSGRRT